MKRIIITILSIIIIGIICIKYIPLGHKSYRMATSSSTIEIPKLSFFKEECCAFSVTFKTIRSKQSIKKELNKILGKYNNRICNNKTIYYDEKNNVTITEYGIESGTIFNTFYIIYDKGNYTNDDCNKIIDPKLIEYQYYHISDEKKETMSARYKYLNENGSKYDVYTDCNGCLLIKKGMGYFDTIENMLISSYISMHDLLSFLDYQVENNEATKEKLKDDETILYRNNNFSLIKCNSKSGNQDIYISDNLEYQESYCK